LSSIKIAINNTTTTLTSPFSVFKCQRLVYPTTSMTSFRRGKEPVNLPEMYSIPFGFVFDLANELRPSRIRNRFCKMMVRHYPLHVQVFGKDSLVLAYEPMTQFVKKIISLVCDLFVHTSNFYTNFVSSIATFNLSGKTALKQLQLIFRSSEKLWRLNTLAGRSDKKRFQPQVNANLPAGIPWMNIFLSLAKDRRKVFTGRLPGYCDTFRNAFHLPMQDNLDWGDLRDMKSICLNIYFKMLRNDEGLLSAFLFEIRKFKTVIEKMVISIVQMTQGLLKGLRISFLKPHSIRLLFKFRQHSCCVMVIQTLLLLSFVKSIIVNPLTEKIVIYKASLAEVRGKKFFLILRRIQTKTECFMDSLHHGLQYTPVFVNVNNYFKERARLISTPLKEMVLRRFPIIILVVFYNKKNYNKMNIRG